MTIFSFNHSHFLFIFFLLILAACQQDSKNYAASIAIDRQAATAKADTLNAEQTYEFAKTISPASEQDSFYFDLMELKLVQFDVKAIREHMEFYKKIRKNEDYPLMVYTYFIGTANFMENKMTDAESAFKKALDLNERLGDKRFKYNIIKQLAHTKQSIGDYPQAVTYFLEALHTAQEYKNLQDVADLRLELSQTYNLLRSYDKTIEMANLAAKFYQQTEDFGYEAKAYSAIGQAFEQKDMVDSADHYYQKALTLQKTIGDPTGIAQNYAMYANFWIELENPSKALEAAKKANSWNQKGAYRGLDGSIKALLGNAFCKVGNTTEGLKHLHDALDFCTKHQIVHEISYLQETLSSVYESMGKEKLALSYFKKHTAIEDSLFTVSKQNSINELNIKYETAEKEKKLAAVTYKARTDRLYGGFGVLMLLGLGTGLWFRQRGKNLALQQEQEILIQNKKLADAEAIIVQQKLEASQSELEKANEDKNSLTNTLLLKNKMLEDFKMRSDSVSTATAQSISTTGLRILTSEQWLGFKEQFDSQRPGFLFKLKEIHPSLTSSETRLFLLINLHFNNQEVADALGISKESVYRGRMRLAKKLELNGAGGLDEYVEAFGV